MTSNTIYDPIAESLGLEPLPDFSYNVSPPAQSISNSGKLNAFFGQSHTEETKLQMRGPRPHVSGENNHFYGKTHTEETKAKIIETHLGRKWSDEINAKKARFGSDNHFYGKTHTEENKKRWSKANKGKCPAKLRSNGERLGSVPLSDPRWKTGEIVHAKTKLDSSAAKTTST